MATVPGLFTPLRSGLPALKTPVITLADQGRVTRDVQFGTNPPTTSITTSQSVDADAQEGGFYGEAPSGDADAQPGGFYGVGSALPGGSPGVGAERDDASTKNAIQQMVNAKFNNQIISQPNALDQYASYTYSLSWYLLAPKDFEKLATTPNSKKTPAGYQLLVRSGGAPEQGRNPMFTNDYYIDNLEITTAMPGGGTRSAHTATELSFTITEPNGITLTNNLYKAVNDLYKKSGVTSKTANYVAAHYMIVIRFYGYDDAGNLVAPAKGGTDPKAVIEKFYPFIITSISFRVANKLVEYQVKGKPAPYNNQFGTNRGTIPFNFELVGQTLGDILNGTTQGTTGTSPPEDGRQTEPVPSEEVFDYNDQPASPFQVGA